jgi:hypothetical protein
MAKLHDNSVVALASSTSCALVSREVIRGITSRNTKRRHAKRRIGILVHGSTVLNLAAMERAA